MIVRRFHISYVEDGYDYRYRSYTLYDYRIVYHLPAGHVGITIENLSTNRLPDVHETALINANGQSNVLYTIKKFKVVVVLISAALRANLDEDALKQELVLSAYYEVCRPESRLFQNYDADNDPPWTTNRECDQTYEELVASYGTGELATALIDKVKAELEVLKATLDSGN